MYRALFIISRLSASGYIFQNTFQLLSDVLYSDECQAKKFSACLKNVPAFSCYSEVL